VPATLLHPESPPDVSTRRSWSWLVGLVGFVGVLAAAWPLSSWQMRQSVAVETTGPMRCTGSTHAKVDGFPDPAYRLVPGIHCRLSYKVTNSAPLTAHLDVARFTLLGPASRIGLRGVDADPQQAGADTTAAVYNLDRDLAAGDSATFSIDAVFNPKGCEAQGATVVITNGVNVEVSFLNVSGDRTGNVAFALVGTAASECPHPR
jgi:hypothetical protein